MYKNVIKTIIKEAKEEFPRNTDERIESYKEKRHSYSKIKQDASPIIKQLRNKISDIYHYKIPTMRHMTKSIEVNGDRENLTLVKKNAHSLNLFVQEIHKLVEELKMIIPNNNHVSKVYTKLTEVLAASRKIFNKCESSSTDFTIEELDKAEEAAKWANEELYDITGGSLY